MKKNTRIFIWSLAALLIAAVITIWLLRTAPKAKRERPLRPVPLVETVTAQATNEPVIVRAAGTVIPARAVVAAARIAGEVIAVSPHFIEGGIFRAGEELVRIDPTDYRLALTEAESAREKARFEYKLELGRQDVARREWELLKSPDATELEKELALRIPHLAAAKAAKAAAEARVEQARLNLERTHVRAPFNAVVLERFVEKGAQTGPAGKIARLAGTDAFRVEAAVGLDRLDYLSIPGSPVRIYSDSGAVREGRVIGRLAQLTPRGRMARLLVEVRDPLCLESNAVGQKPLLLGEFVRMELKGRTLTGVYRIPRRAIHGDDKVWLEKNGRLEIRKLEICWKDRDFVLARGLSDGERLILSDLPAPVPGMRVRPVAPRSGTDGSPAANTLSRSAEK